MFLPSQTYEINLFFQVQVRQKDQVFRVRADKTTKSAFRVNRFLFVDMPFFSSSAQTTDFFRH